MRSLFVRSWRWLVGVFDRPVFRLLVFACVLGSVASVFALRRASAEVGAVALDMGEKLSIMTDTVVSKTNLSFNGQLAEVSSVRTVKTLDGLFEQFAALCQKPELHAEELDGRTMLKATRSKDPLDVGVFSFRNKKSEGVMLCFGGSESLRALAGKASGALKGDLTALGQVRYLFARQREGQVTGLLVQSQGPWNVFEMFPEEGDVPGADMIAGARPLNSTRAFSVAGDGYGLTTHRSRMSVDGAVRSYEEALRARGYEVGPLPEADTAKKRPLGQEVRIATNDQGAFVISAHLDGDESIVSTVRLGGAANVRVR